MLGVAQVARHLTSWHLISVILLHHQVGVRPYSHPTQLATLPLFNPVDIIGPFLPIFTLLFGVSCGGSVNTCFTCTFSSLLILSFDA
jgi:hypothetical protein